jgi:signal transduction histidine kinase
MPTATSLLIVDDSDAERELMARTLMAAFPSADVKTAAHPREARQLCESATFDCVMLDYNMPETDGVALGQELRSADAHLPIVLMTSVGDEMLAAEALRSGISDYVPKSRVTTESLRRIVERAMHSCQQARVIEEQRNELETFAYALAHDFKQPIRQISTFTQMISDGIREGATDTLHQHLTFLGDAARRLGKLVDVMAQYTLLNQPPELSDLDLGAILGGVKASLGPYLSEHGRVLALPKTAPMIRGNEALTSQVLQNLIVNGLTYNRSAKPHVDVTVRRVDGLCEIDIRDNGIGIEAEYLAEIFNPLMRLHNASEYPGSGLGLTLARKAIHAQEGSIWCESTPGKGSVFHVRIPAVGT